MVLAAYEKSTYKIVTTYTEIDSPVIQRQNQYNEQTGQIESDSN